MEHNPFLPLLLITILAFVVPLLANRMRRLSLPIVVGEIMAGILIGRSGLNLVEPSATLDFLAEFGFAFLMFLSGLEIDVNLLRSSGVEGGKGASWKRPVPLALLIFGGTLGLGLLVSWGLAQAGMVENPVLLGLILSTTSLGVVVPVLKERNLLGSDFGQALLIQASIADFATLLLLTVAIALSTGGLELNLLLIPLLLLAFMLAARAARQMAAAGWIRDRIQEISSATAQIRVRGAFALMVAWVVLAEALGVELILGAFLGGAILGLVTSEEASTAREKLEAIGFGFFIPVFFIMVGVEFNLPALLSSRRALLLVPLLVIVSFLVKLAPGLLLRARFGWRQSIAGGLLLSSRLSMIIAAAAITLEIGAIDDAVNSSIILLAIVSTTAAPLLFNRLSPVVQARPRSGVLLVGVEPMVELLGRRFGSYDERVTILCSDPERVGALERIGHRVVMLEDAERSLRRAGADSARALVDLRADSEHGFGICRLAIDTFGIPLVVARVSDVESVPTLRRMGVRVVQPALATAMALEGALRYPTAFDVLVHEAEDVDVGEATLRNRALIGLRVRDLDLPGNALILSMRRQASVMVPDGDTRLELGDRIDMIGSPDSLERAMAVLRAG
jgi:Kef-type K+ transport system membrane component KefB/Trk K+ transport system NAD-binding subunit